MALQKVTKIYQTRGRLYIYIPSDVAKDSQFPFEAGDKIKVRIDKGKLVIEKT
jgi:hypothetical protein